MSDKIDTFEPADREPFKAYEGSSPCVYLSGANGPEWDVTSPEEARAWASRLNEAFRLGYRAALMEKA